jgi:hypothetical protein
VSTGLDAAMQQQRADSRWRILGLGARGPVPELKAELDLFGQFVGDWEILPWRAARRASPSSLPTGEVHVDWILGGTAVQDVWGHIDPKSRQFVPLGTTVRFYDPDLGAWRSTWLSPYQRRVRRFIAKAHKGEIVLKELDQRWPREQWIFSDITIKSFRWRARKRSSIRGQWRVTQDYLIRRKPTTTREK